MKFTERRILISVAGAILTSFIGVILVYAPFGQPWLNASYDYSFRFGTRMITNKVSLIMMDSEAYDQFRQRRGQPWDRALHARLLNKLADDGCALVVMDCFFRESRERLSDDALGSAMRRQRHIVLMAEQSRITRPGLVGMYPLLPTEPFYSAAGANCGVAWFDSDPDSIVRRDWPFPSPGPYPSLAQAAARFANPHTNQEPQERWLRYYGRDGEWSRLSYGFALTRPTNYFRDQIVFVGNQPRTTLISDGEPDKFGTPYMRWTGEAVGGVDIILTAYLNSINGDWLQRVPSWAEGLILGIIGVVLGGTLCRMRPLRASIFAVGIALTVVLVAVSCSYFTNYWIPWLPISAGQVPCALGWAYLTHKSVRSSQFFPHTDCAQLAAAPARPAPEIQGYKLFNPPFGEGSYGKVWVARKDDGEWRAVKVVYLAKFDYDPGPYEREFNGIRRYQPISGMHPGLLRVDFVSEKLAGDFYYVMELGDSLEPSWVKNPSTFKPRDLANERARTQGRRLPVPECLRIGLALSDALGFLHRHGLAHRDIKPQNIVFVNGHPKLADLGLIAEIRPPDQPRTYVGTPGYMPPPPEFPGTPQADIYALGIMLYVLCTGRDPAFFPEISTTLVGNQEECNFFAVNSIILKACQPNPKDRYSSALEMRRALHEAQSMLEKGMPRQS